MMSDNRLNGSETSRETAPRRRLPLPALLRHFRKSGRGSVAIEFSLVAIPFFLFLFAIIEVSLLFFVGQILDNAVSSVARQIRTGQAEVGNMDEAEFKRQVCEGMLGIGSCSANLYVDVKSQTSFSAADLSGPLDADGNMKPTTFNRGGPLFIIFVGLFYTGRVFFDLLTTTGQTADGKRLLSSIIAFRNEPYR